MKTTTKSENKRAPKRYQSITSAIDFTDKTHTIMLFCHTEENVYVCVLCNKLLIFIYILWISRDEILMKVK